MRRFLALAFAFLTLTCVSYGQGVRHDNVATSFVNNLYKIIPNAIITVCNGTTLPMAGNTCTGLATIYSNVGITTTQANPFNADNFGNYGFYAAPLGAGYVVSVAGSGLTTYSYPLTLSCQPSSNCILTGNLMAASPCVFDGLIYITTAGCYTTLAAAYAAAPPCTLQNDLSNTNPPTTYASFTFTHCGDIYLPAGSSTVPSEIDISSSYIRIHGAGNGTSVINWSGTTGCAIKWTRSPFVDDWAGMGGIDGVRFDGFNGSAGTCGLWTAIAGFRMSNVGFANFVGAGSVGFKETTNCSNPSGYVEKSDIEAQFKNNTISWLTQKTSNDLCTTLGYSRFHMSFDYFAGQTAWKVDGGGFSNVARFDNSQFMLTFNGKSSSGSGTAIWVTGGANVFNNLYMIHIESTDAGPEVQVDAGAMFTGFGSFNQSRPSSNVLVGIFDPQRDPYPQKKDRQISLINPDFEGNLAIPPAGWIYQNNGSGSTSVLSYETGTPYTGKKQSLKLVSSGAAPGIASLYNYSVFPGDVYSLQGAMKSDGTALAQIHLAYFDKNGAFLGQGLLASNNVAWVVQTVTTGVPANAVSATVILDDNVNGTVWFDEISVQKVNFPATVQVSQVIASQGSPCTNGELALSAGWQSTGSATVTAVAGNGQTCSWIITTGTTTAANPTVTDTLTNALPAATTVCWMNIYGGTHTAIAGESLRQTTLSATAPVFTANFTPTAGGTTYFVTRGCGP